MNLSDSEKRDICKLIEEGKNLPEKYRFLLFEQSKQVELKWNGKSDGVSNIVLPFQIIEQVDEPRKENVQYDQGVFDLLQGRQKTGWTNKLIWGDNKYILSALKNGPMRDEIEDAGGIKLIYIDPPFDTAADFSLNVEVGDDNSYDKQPNVLEHIAYRDTWGRGDDSFLSMIYERLLLARDLLSSDGSIYIHCDWRVNYMLRSILDEIFGKNNFINEIIWKRRGGTTSPDAKIFPKITDSILFYSKSEHYQFENQFYQDENDPYKKRFNRDDGDGRKYNLIPLNASQPRPNLMYTYKGYKSPKFGWSVSLETMEKYDNEGLLYFPENKDQRIYKKSYFENWKGQPVTSLWTDISLVNPVAKERLNYPTQKPEELLERILKTSSKPNDIILDFFSGSGTSAAVAEKLGRKWICADLGKFAIHTTRKRMIGVQRELKQDGKNWRSFEILNLGKYQREYFLTDDHEVTDEISIKDKKMKIFDFENLIFEAYKAERISGFKTLHGKKGDDFISLGPVNQPLSRNHIEEVIAECLKNNILSVHILGFEYEMGLFPTIQQEAKKKGLRLVFKHIPIDIFDKRAVQKGEVIFHDVAYIEFKCNLNSGNISVELEDFAVFYNEENFAIEENLRPGRSKVVIEQGQILEKRKNKDGDMEEKIITKNWFDWIDYWSVDFNYESKKEYIKYFDKNGIVQETWTGNYVFENEWQSFRSKGSQNKLELKSSERKFTGNSTKVAVKVIDIFGNDTMKVLEINS